MASKHREEKIVAAVAYPKCGAAVGEWCHFHHESTFCQQGQRDGRVMVHTVRRLAWQEQKRGLAQ